MLGHSGTNPSQGNNNVQQQHPNALQPVVLQNPFP